MKMSWLLIISLLISVFPAVLSAAPVVVNETGPACELKGVWAPSGSFSTRGCVGNDYHYTSRHAPYAKTGREKAVFTPELPAPGKYKVEVSWRGTQNRSSRVTYEVVHKYGKTSKTLDQRTSGATWAVLGEFEFDAGKKGCVAMISDGGGSASVDAARFTPVSGVIPDGGIRGLHSSLEGVADLKEAGDPSAGAEEVVSLNYASPGTKTYIFISNKTAYVTPYLETYGRAALSVKIRKASGAEIEWMKWERRGDRDPAPLFVDGRPVAESMREDDGDPSPAPAEAYEYRAEKGDVFILTLGGKFGKARPSLRMKVK